MHCNLRAYCKALALPFFLLLHHSMMYARGGWNFLQTLNCSMQGRMRVLGKPRFSRGASCFRVSYFWGEDHPAQSGAMTLARKNLPTYHLHPKTNCDKIRRVPGRIGFNAQKPKAKTECRRPMTLQERADPFGSRKPKTESQEDGGQASKARKPKAENHIPKTESLKPNPEETL